MKKKVFTNKLNLKRSTISKLDANFIIGGCPTGSLCWFTDGCTQTSCAPDCEITNVRCEPRK